MPLLLLLRVVVVSSVTETVAAADADLVSFFFHLSLPFWPLQIFIFLRLFPYFPSLRPFRLVVIKIWLLAFTFVIICCTLLGAFEVLGYSLYVSASIFRSSLRWYKICANLQPLHFSISSL